MIIMFYYMLKNIISIIQYNILKPLKTLMGQTTKFSNFIHCGLRLAKPKLRTQLDWAKKSTIICYRYLPFLSTFILNGMSS